MSSNLEWLQSAESLVRQPSPVHEYLQHVETAQQICRVMDGLQAIEPGEYSAPFRTEGLEAAHDGQARYVVEHDASGSNYLLKVVQKQNTAALAPVVASIVKPREYLRTSQQQVDADVSIIENWADISQREADLPLSERTAYPRCAFRMPDIFLADKSRQVKRVNIPASGQMDGFTVLVRDTSLPSVRASFEQATAVLTEVESLWDIPKDTDAQRIYLATQFAHVAINVAPAMPELDGKSPLLQVGGSDVNLQLIDWLSKNSTNGDGKPVEGLTVYAVESTPGVLARFVICSSDL